MFIHMLHCFIFLGLLDYIKDKIIEIYIYLRIIDATNFYFHVEDFS